MTTRSPLIVLEGGDGAGTTTQTFRLGARIRRTGRNVLETRQPSDGPVGRVIREFLTGKREPLTSPIAFQMLFVADRYEHVSTVIRPALEAGTVVVCDRFALSTAIYAAASEPKYRCDTCNKPVAGFAGTGCDEQAHPVYNRTSELLRFASDMHAILKLRPTLTIVLSVPSEVAAARRASRGGTPELLETAELQRRICSLYSSTRALTSVDGSIAVVDGSRPVHEVEDLVWEAVCKAIPDLHEPYSRTE